MSPPTASRVPPRRILGGTLALAIAFAPLLTSGLLLPGCAAGPGRQGIPGASGGAAGAGDPAPAETGAPVKAWQERISIPTYLLGPADPNPMFYTGESYQGAQKRIYPYPLLDDLTHVKEDREYTAVWLENEYVRICVLPELGGRLFSATDKTNGYEYFYRQGVVKPALIGMLGAWISGGIEWCAFHHHRNTTFMPVDHTISEAEDGSRTVWIGETERRHRMRWLIGLTLRPGSSRLDATVKLFNRTSLPHSILYWANVAVHVNPDYQVVFPPSVQVATYHSKIDFTHWPVSRGRYRGVDYTGVDVSWWKNSHEANSFFAWDLREDFMGGYDHGRKAGVVHVANHHVVCGAKLWEWGTGPSARMWDGILTDEDGPYAELMVGAWSDNQPDYSWIQPHEVKVFQQSWYPVREIGGFKAANADAAVNLDLRQDGVAVVGFHASAAWAGARVTIEAGVEAGVEADVEADVEAGGKAILEETIDIAPDRPYRVEVPIPEGLAETDIRAALLDADGNEIVAYRPRRPDPLEDLPPPARPPSAPQDVPTIEELYLTGLRVEQIHNPSVDPLAYYREALARDPGDSRSNTALGRNLLSRGLYAEAEAHLRKAIERVSAEYTRPRDAEAYYHLGAALRLQGKVAEAEDAFWRASWDHASSAAARYELAEIACGRGDYRGALEHLARSLATNGLDTRARAVAATVFRKLGDARRALLVSAAVLADDPLDFHALNERVLAARASWGEAAAATALGDLSGKMRGHVEAYLELAADYAGLGLWDEAIDVLRRPVDAGTPFASTYPLVHYWLGWLLERKGDAAAAREAYARGAASPADLCFPFRIETADVLRAALAADPADSRAWYYLGNLLYDSQPEKAIDCWETSRGLDGSLALVHRNLGWGYYRSQSQVGEAIASYERAIAANDRDPRLFFELDLLYEIGNVAPARRLEVLEQHHEVVVRRKESLLREIMALVLVGEYGRAIEHLADNYFHVREGGGEIHDVYVDAHLLRGIERLEGGDADEALRHFLLASEYPENLSVGRPKNDRRAPQVAHHIGLAEAARGETDAARASFRKAADQKGTGGWPEARYYQACSLAELGEAEPAEAIFDDLIASGREALQRGEPADFFAKFGEQETRMARTASAHYTVGLGLLGKGDRVAARAEFDAATKANTSHVWARRELEDLGAAP